MIKFIMENVLENGRQEKIRNKEVLIIETGPSAIEYKNILENYIIRKNLCDSFKYSKKY